MRRSTSLQRAVVQMLLAALVFSCLILPVNQSRAGDEPPFPPYTVVPDTTKIRTVSPILDPGLPVLDLVLVTLSIL
jgi:hypothetical protein